MDDTVLEQRITENMKAIFGFALTRLGDAERARELASDILYELVRSAPTLKDADRFYGFMWKVAENTYIDYLRKRSKDASRTVELDESIADDAPSPLEEMVRREELNLLRRELSLLSKQYRRATVLYYMEHLSCAEVAERLQISTEMVKYYLFRARKIIREGMNMERLYGEKSYRPNGFEIDFWGTRAGDDHEYRDFERRKIKGNILLAAYYSPVTVQEISIELGVALPYLEDEIQLLVDRQYLVCRNGRYLTNIPIFTSDCTSAIKRALQSLVRESAQAWVALADEFDARFGARFASVNLFRWQKLLLCLHAALVETGSDLEKYYGELPAGGPYSLVNGGGGRGVIWGRSKETTAEDPTPRGIQGIYNGCPSSDKRASVIAINFRQTLHAQHFEGRMVDPVVLAATGRFGELSVEWQQTLEALGYAKAGKANFAVWTYQEYEEIQNMLRKGISILSELNRKTAAIAAGITADLAPSHIRTSAQYVGALVYRFDSIDQLVSTLCEMGWLGAIKADEKPAMCVVEN